MPMQTSDNEYVTNFLVSLIIGGGITVQKSLIFMGWGDLLSLFCEPVHRVCGGKYKTKSCCKHVS